MLDQSKEKLNFQEFFLNLLGHLTEREQEVLKKRYQLTADLADTSTLKQIGDIYGITRERVRQIEREAIAKVLTAVKKSEFHEAVDSLRANLLHYLTRKGGVSSEQELISEHVLPNYQFDFLHLNAYLFVLDFILDEVKRILENENFYTHWQLKSLDSAKLTQLIDKIAESLNSRKQSSNEVDLLVAVEKDLMADEEKALFADFLKRHPEASYGDFIKSLLAITKKIEKNILAKWGLSEWPEIRPKKLSDKIELIFQKHAKPLHFREVASSINEAKFDRKNICAATVHNELIANEAYVLIGRGIYAKKEWGFAPGTVADIVIDILTKAGVPMSKEAIYEAVLQQRKVNPSTIYLSLINRDRFLKDNQGFYQLNK